MGVSSTRVGDHRGSARTVQYLIYSYDAEWSEVRTSSVSSALRTWLFFALLSLRPLVPRSSFSTYILYSTHLIYSYAAQRSEVRTSAPTLDCFLPSSLSARPLVPRSSFSSRPDLCFSAGSGLPWRCGSIPPGLSSLAAPPPLICSPRPFLPPSVCVCVCDGETWTCTRFDLPPSSHTRTLPLSSPPSLSQLLSLSQPWSWGFTPSRFRAVSIICSVHTSTLDTHNTLTQGALQSPVTLSLTLVEASRGSQISPPTFIYTSFT